jgi:hypothetical protein
VGDSPTTRLKGDHHRPAVAVVMPFAGSPAQARGSLAALSALRTRAGDTVLLADNSAAASAAGSLPAGSAATAPTVIPALGEHSPARARNAGAAAAAAVAAAAGNAIEWLLFLDADCRPSPDLIDAFFAEPIPDGVGAVAGEIHAVPGGDGLAARYGTSRNFLNSATHMAHPFRPRVSAANLLVRRAAFDAVGGFRQGIRTAEDTDFCWRLQDAGWTLAVRPQATAGHAYRTSLRELRAQWRGYAAGRAWLGRTYEGFHPEPALKRALRRAGLGALPGVGRCAPIQGSGAPRPGTPLTSTQGSGAPLTTARVNPGTPPRSRRERIEFLVVDVLLGIEELRGFRASNDPH